MRSGFLQQKHPPWNRNICCVIQVTAVMHVGNTVCLQWPRGKQYVGVTHLFSCSSARGEQFVHDRRIDASSAPPHCRLSVSSMAPSSPEKQQLFYHVWHTIFLSWWERLYLSQWWDMWQVGRPHPRQMYLVWTTVRSQIYDDYQVFVKNTKFLVTWLNKKKSW